MQTSSGERRSDTFNLILFWVAVVAAIVVCVLGDGFANSVSDVSRPLRLVPWWAWAGVFAGSLLFWWYPGVPQRPLNAPRRRSGGDWPMLAILFALSLLCTWAVGDTFYAGMPPAYHDEYSYLFQAKTFLAGRTHMPAPEHPEFFDQMHVLNHDGVFASRYFPGVGIWMAPWVSIGWAFWGHYLAGAFCVVLVCWITRECVTQFVGTSQMDQTKPSKGLLVCCSIAVANNPVLLLVPVRLGAYATPEFSIVLYAITALILALVVGFAGRLLLHRGVASMAGLLAGLLCLTNPGVLVFGNLLLSHHPALLGLLGFSLAFLKSRSSRGFGWPLAGGGFLGFAMLCRPLTAFGFALPWAIHLAWTIYRGELHRPALRTALALTPIALSVVGLAAYNASITGSAVKTPYGEYTRIYTPAHLYGFQNVSRGRLLEGEKTIKNYNKWAQEKGDLGFGMAVDLVALRALASLDWTVGQAVGAWLAIAMIGCLSNSWGLRLLMFSSLGIHLAYFAWAFEGIFNLSYVFETVPIVLILLCCSVAHFAVVWGGHLGRLAWIGVFIAVAMIGPRDRFRTALGEVLFARRYYQQFDQALNREVRGKAIVFIDPDPADRHRELIHNSPTLDDRILRVRDRKAENLQLIGKYPGRRFLFYNARTRQMSR